MINKIYDDNLFQLLKNYIYTGGNPETAIMAFGQMGWPEESIKACLDDVTAIAKAQYQCANAFIMNYELYNMIVNAIKTCQASDSSDMNRFANKLQGVAGLFNANDIMLQQKNVYYGTSYPESGDDYIIKCIAIMKLIDMLQACDCCASCPELKTLLDKCLCMSNDPSWVYKTKVIDFFDRNKRKRLDDRFVKQFKNVMISLDPASEYNKVLDMFSFMPECSAALKELKGEADSEEKTEKVNEAAKSNVGMALANAPSNIDKIVNNIVVLAEQENGKMYFGLFGKCFAIDEKFDVVFANASKEFNMRNSNINNMFDICDEGLVSKGFDGKIIFDKASEKFRVGTSTLKEGTNPYWDLVRAGVRSNNSAEYSALTDIITNGTALALLPVIFTESFKYGVKAAVLKESKTAIVENRLSGDVKIVKCQSVTELTEKLNKEYGVNIYDLVKESLGEESTLFSSINFLKNAISEAKSKIKALREAKDQVRGNNDLIIKLDEAITMWNRVIFESEQEMSKLGTSNTYFVTFKYKTEQLPHEETYIGNEFTTEDEIISKYDLKGVNVEWYDIKNASAKPNVNIQAITNAKTAEQQVNVDAKPESQNGGAAISSVAATKQNEKGSSVKTIKESVTYEVEIKEKGNPHILKTTYTGSDDTTEDEVIKFFGLKEADVESFNITKK